MYNISKNISYIEATQSPTALKYKLNNEPNNIELENMKYVAEIVFEPLRLHIDEPIRVNSFFRSPILNQLLGGDSHSQHMQGCAIDMSIISPHFSNAYIFKYIKKNLPFDKLIWEFGSDISPAWVHVSLVKSNNRRESLKSYWSSGKKKFKVI